MTDALQLPYSPYYDHPSGEGRPEGVPDFMPYVSASIGQVCIDRLPCTQEEIRACGDALTAIYSARREVQG